MKIILVDAAFTFTVETNNGFEIYQPLNDLLEKFPNRKILLTGAPDDMVEKYGLDNVPYEIFSLKQDPPKSDAKYYQVMLKHFNFKTDDIIYFEHNTDAVDAARSVGINTYHYDETKRDLESLKKFLEANL